MAATAVRKISKAAWRNWNTLQTLWACVYLICALDALLLLSTIIGAEIHRDAMKAIGKDTGPSIIHAQNIKASMADMDANAANELLIDPSTPAMKKLRDTALKDYDAERDEAGSALIEAAKNITFDEREQKPLEAIQKGLATFEAQVQKARVLYEWKEPGYIDAYREAAKTMDQPISGLFAQADELDRVNRTELDGAYDSQSGKSSGTVFLLLLTGAALVAGLVGVQNFLNQRTHRILNPCMVLSTLLTLGFVFYTFGMLAKERRQLKIAKEDAFESIHTLWKARALAYASNADESRYLLDTAHAQEHEDAFNRKMGQLITLPRGASFKDAIAAANNRRMDGYKGLMVDELNNITFVDAGEHDHAMASLRTLGEYIEIDREIRRLETSGKHADALRLCIGDHPGESNFAFDKFDKAMEATIKINQDEFDKAVSRGFDALSYFELKAAIIAIAIAALAILGLHQRIREYS